MRRRSLIALTAAAACGVAASGFPRRLGLTSSQASVSLPGDLLIPDADVVVDRGIEIAAPVEDVWAVLESAFEGGDQEIAREESDYLLMRAPAPGNARADEDEDEQGTCVVALVPITSGRTLVHLRERHRSGGDRLALWAGVLAESVSTMLMLRDIRAAVLASA
ncbi:hypothetical protein M3T53_04510 [Actinomyces sp. B33]|uniref:hypothetical protein n=1 Tax=Actinomyces sp. B33 TaxID=2942131 RepID=UPI002341EC7A|nr:hypothetical protein [Actinomyces sp. B33]MDC4232974.1 hypothetical protein [Actinomyces sp. B33]